MTAEPIRFALYARTSTDDLQDPVESKRWQQSRAEALIAGQGEIVCTFHDIGRSRSLPWKRRPEATALLDEAARPATRRFDAVVVAEPARAFYGGQYGLVAPVLAHHDVGLWCPELGGKVDPDSEAHDMMMMLFGGMSKGERNRVKIRTSTAMKAMAEVGRFTGGCPPYGYSTSDLGPHTNPQKAKDGRRLKGLEVDPYAAPIVAEMFDRYLAGDGLGVIAAALTARGVLSPSAYRPEFFPHRADSQGAWSRSAVRAILRNPVYLGKAVYGRLRRAEILVDATDAAQGYETRQRRNGPEKWTYAREQTHPAIVTPDAFEAVQARFEARQGGRGPRALAKGRKPYALRGLITCTACGRKLYHCTIQGYRYATCRLSSNEYARNPALAATHPKTSYLREDKVIPVLDEYILRSFDPENAEQTARDLAAAANDDAEIARRDALSTKWRRALRDAETRRDNALRAMEAGADSAVVARYINEAERDRKAALADLEMIDRDRPPTAAELLAVIEELRDDLAALAAADDPAEKAKSYRRFGVRVEWSPRSPDVTVEVKYAPTSEADGGITYSDGGGGTVTAFCTRTVLRLAA